MNCFSLTHCLVSISPRLLSQIPIQPEVSKRLGQYHSGEIPSYSHKNSKGVGRARPTSVSAAQRTGICLLTLAVASRPLCSWADSQMYKQMESRRLVPTNEDILFHKNHTKTDHVNRTSPSLPRDQTHSPTQFLKAPTSHSPGWWAWRHRLEGVLHQKHSCVFYKTIHVPWTQRRAEESATSYRTDNQEAGAAGGDRG